MFIEAMPVTRLLRHNKNVSRHRLDIARLQTLLQDHNPGQAIGAATCRQPYLESRPGA
ncbi:MAG TPA: hypothetical protein VFS25_21955 [Chitinophaga sp.]|uniref:hypothetical protein n=1 Tax=Chitinophaga sp. TaxID=1869181 RepID=UPI002DBDE8A3|nr:hypothetical protein [Chitinophaga sp.]HEU4555527.1 hypothetical protein [Chitinophaga sp.]